MTEPDSPTDLSKRSWWETLKRTVKEFRNDNLTDWAAALTYYGVLALFPALIALVSITGLVMDPKELTSALTDIVGQLGPASAVETFRGPIEQVSGNTGTGVVLLIAGVVGALYSASAYVGAFTRASNSIYETEEGRPFYKLRPLQIVITAGMILMVAICAIAVVISVPLAEQVGNVVGAGDAAVSAWDIAKWPVIVVVVSLMIAFLYYISPNIKQPGFRWISPGSSVAVVLWILTSLAFAFYVANFSSYNETYGSLAGVIAFLVWLWITNLAILFGAELDAELERERELEAGVPDEKTIALEPRDPPKEG